MDKVVIEDYYHMTMNENMNYMKLTHLLSSLWVKFRALFCTSTLTSYFLIVFSNEHTIEK